MLQTLLSRASRTFEGRRTECVGCGRGPRTGVRSVAGVHRALCADCLGRADDLARAPAGEACALCDKRRVEQAVIRWPHGETCAPCVALVGEIIAEQGG